MNNQRHSAPRPDVVDALATQLLDCGGVLSQIVGHMIKMEASGASAPEAAPVPAVAHRLIRDAITDVTQRHSDEQITAVTMVLHELTNAICENVFIVPLDANGR